MRDLSRIGNPHQSSQQCWILNPLSGARDWTGILLDTSQVHYHRATRELRKPFFTGEWFTLWRNWGWGFLFSNTVGPALFLFKSFFFFFLSNKLSLQQFYVCSKAERKTWSSHQYSSSTNTQPPTINVQPQRGTFAAKDEPTLTYHYPPKFVV